MVRPPHGHPSRRHLHVGQDPLPGRPLPVVGAAGRFLGLFVISFVLIVICALLSMLVNDENPDFFEAMWWAMTRVADAGTMGDD